VLDTGREVRHQRPVIDLEAYLGRIGVSGPLAVERRTLDVLSAAHAKAIPFENLDVLLGRPIELELGAIERKLVHEQRGGYCFEQNTLMLAVLQRLGFEARPISARVRWKLSREHIPARTHLFLRVELAGESWLVDVGVGSLSLTSAIRLDTGEEQPTAHEPRRIVREAGRLFHQVRFGDAWHDVCEFTLEEMPEIDRIVANWYTSAHLGSHFKNRLIAARADADGKRRGLLNRELTIRHRDGSADRREIADPDELLAVLDEHFGLRFAPGTRFACPALDWPSPR
jgi:N-hydroxyarylamine O-acetyltransferase